MGTTDSRCIETEINKKIEEIKKKQEELTQLQQQKQNIPPAPVVNIPITPAISSNIPPAPSIQIPGVPPAPSIAIPGVLPAPSIAILGVPPAPNIPISTINAIPVRSSALAPQPVIPKVAPQVDPMEQLRKAITGGVKLKPVTKQTNAPVSSANIVDKSKMEKITAENDEKERQKLLEQSLNARRDRIQEDDEWDDEHADAWTNLKSFSSNEFVCNIKGAKIKTQDELNDALRVMKIFEDFKKQHQTEYNQLLQEQNLTENDILEYQNQIQQFRQQSQVPSVYPSTSDLAAAMSNQPVYIPVPSAPPQSVVSVASGPSVVVAPKLTKELRVRNHKREINIENDDFGQFLSSNDELSYQASSRANANIKQLMLQASCAQKTCYDSYLLTMYYWQQHDDQKFKRQKDADSCNIFKDQVLGK